MRTNNQELAHGKDGMEDIAATLLRVATPEMSPKQLLKAARKVHPKASKKEIAQAAFYSIISAPDQEPQKAKKQHAFAIKTRSDLSDPTEPDS
jgi:hypothetical protein